MTSIKTVNPATNEIVKEFEEFNSEQIEQAVSTAAKAFVSWRKTSYKERGELLHKVAALMRERKGELSKLMTIEMGKLIGEAEAEIDLSADIFDYYADRGEEFLADKVLSPKYGSAFVRHSPIGVLLGVQPWNFPFYQIARFTAPNIMIGNTILLKHASNVPQCGIAVEELFKDANAPVGLYTNLLIPGSKISQLLSDKRIVGASLTGSEKAGESLASAAGSNAKKSVLELGGSDAFIVLEDADLDEAVNWAFVGRMNNAGQCCVASKRIIVVAEKADEFLDKFKKKMSGLKVGDPLDSTTELGPLSTESAAVQLKDQVDRAVAGGAEVVLGGNRIDRPGAYLEATILTGIKPDNPIYYEELFGPVAAFYRVDDEKEAIRLANDSPFGLGGSVFTSDVERGQRVADEIDTGMVFINHPTWTTPNLPFGGVKHSGYGRELSELGISEFVNKKLIRTSDLKDPF